MRVRRAELSTLLEHGHSHARQYPLGMLMDEARIVTRRTNARLATEAQLVQAAVSAILSKDGQKHFRKMITKLMEV